MSKKQYVKHTMSHNATESRKSSRRPTVFSTLAPAVPTEVFDSYWRFAALRQDVFFARFEGRSRPWSKDPILNEYKFTNAYRASDRVSQFLIRHVIYAGPQEPDELFFRILLFKLFNKIETWKLLKATLGEISWNTYRYSDYDRVLAEAMSAKATIYSAAYIMASGHQIFNVGRKHQGHLKLLELMLNDAVPQRIAECASMRDAFELLRSYPLIGDFLAYQLVTDLNYSELTSFSEMDFTIPGPGARDGIRKCFHSLGGLSEVDIIRLMADRQEYEFDRLGLQFRDLWGRRLQLIDIQNLFCEVDKYARVKHPSVAGVSGRTRIKQKFRQTDDPVQYFYPPKWELALPTMPLPQVQGKQQSALF
ncbi:nucleotide kinase domain-containing protein [Paraburkholderia sp. MM5482-R1]|uniref:nucleotide kinase domain-containing protein n=1 Tax=unclassified Paraburkholderia TaxID=2615204 RepID=UPI003D19EC0B